MKSEVKGQKYCLDVSKAPVCVLKYNKMKSNERDNRIITVTTSLSCRGPHCFAIGRNWQGHTLDLIFLFGDVACRATSIFYT